MKNDWIDNTGRNNKIHSVLIDTIGMININHCIKTFSIEYTKIVFNHF